MSTEKSYEVKVDLQIPDSLLRELFATVISSRAYEQWTDLKIENREFIFTTKRLKIKTTLCGGGYVSMVDGLTRLGDIAYNSILPESKKRDLRESFLDILAGKFSIHDADLVLRLTVIGDSGALELD